MQQISGSENEDADVPKTISFNDEQRIDLIANLIVERIMADQQGGEKLLAQLQEGNV